MMAQSKETVLIGVVPDHSTVGTVHYPRLIVDNERCMRQCGLSFRQLVERAAGKAALNPNAQYDVVCPGPTEGFVTVCNGEVNCTGTYGDTGLPVGESDEHFQPNITHCGRGANVVEKIERALQAGAKVHDYTELIYPQSA